MRRAVVLGVRILLLLLSVTGLGLFGPARSVLAATDPWSTSLHDISRSGASTDTTIASSQANQLHKLWSLSTGAPIASQAAIVNGVAYIGSWNGYEYALNAATGAVIWKTFLGITTGNADCDPQSAGVSSAATVQNGVVYVGGGDSNWYALNASNGSVLWSVPTGDNSAAGGHYNWSSPLITGGFAYVGISSLGDCPLVQGQLLKVNISTGQVAATLNLVPNGQQGAGIWTSPAYNPVTDTIYATTGTEQSNAQTYAQAIIAIKASTMTVTDYWHLPESEAVADSDWTTSAMLYADANGRQLVLATNKNGYTYALQQSNLAAGYVWRQQVAIGNNCAACGFSTVSSAAMGNGMIFQAGGVTTINGQGYGGSVQALNPATGAVIWRHVLSGPVIGAVTYDNGMVIDGGGSALEVLDASNGHRLYSYDTQQGSWIYAAPAVSSGVIVAGNTFGTIYALGLPSTPPPPPPADANCPTNWLCQDIGSPTPSGSETVANGSWNIAVGGSGVGGGGDSFRLMSQSAAGDTQIIARVMAQQGISSNSQAGIMLRQSNDPGSPFYAVFATPNGAKVVYRNSFGGTANTINSPNPGNVPVYLEIQRKNDTLQAATSTDGITYTLVPGATETVVEPYTSLAGLAVSSDMSGVSGTATITNVSIGVPNNTPQNTPPATACPTGWSCGDIGDPATVGDQSLSGGTWMLKGSGSGIDSSSDQLHYVWQAVAGDVTVTTRITGQTNTSNSAKTGLMMRASNAADAAYYGVFIQPGGGIVVQYRDTKGLPIFNPIATAAGALPQYLQIVRSGTTFTSYTSKDGNNWQPIVGSTLTENNLAGSILAGLAGTSTNTGATSTVTADNLSIANTSVTPPTTCPATWACQDIGSPLPSGSQYYYNGVWSVLAGGKDIWDTSDEFHFVSQTLTGDGTITTHISHQDNTDPWAKAGIMVRASNDPAAPYYALLTTPGNGTVIQYRTATGNGTQQVTGITTGAPAYLKVTRAGNTFTAYTSTDGKTWTAYPGGSITVTLPTTALAGMANTAHSQFNTGTAAFDGFTLTANNPNLPGPWADNDIDNATPAGSASYSGSTFTVKGGGNDIWSTSYGNLDQSHYVSQALSGDGSIVARVTSQTNTSPWAKAGIMLKQSAAADAPYVLLAVTPSNGIVFQNGFSSSTGGGAYTFPNAWLKLSRSGSTITGYVSANGTSWTTVGTATLTTTDPITAGLFVTSHASGTLSTTTFDNVAVTQGSTHLPAPWADLEVGNPSTAGSASFANGVFTVNGAGNDIWGTAGGNLDEFHYVEQPENGSQTIIARVTSQTNTSPWAKAGIMLKQSTAAGSPYALLAVTPGNGIVFQYNYTNSVSGPTYTFPNAWLKLTLSGGTVTAYASPDGTTWTQVGSTALTLTNPATIGLFVCSHASGTLSTAAFDNVSVTSP